MVTEERTCYIYFADVVLNDLGKTLGKQGWLQGECMLFRTDIVAVEAMSSSGQTQTPKSLLAGWTLHTCTSSCATSSTQQFTAALATDHATQHNTSAKLL